MVHYSRQFKGTVKLHKSLTLETLEILITSGLFGNIMLGKRSFLKFLWKCNILVKPDISEEQWRKQYYETMQHFNIDFICSK